MMVRNDTFLAENDVFCLKKAGFYNSKYDAKNPKILLEILTFASLRRQKPKNYI